MHFSPALSVVVNPSAGRGRARRLLPKILAGLAQGLPQATIQLHQAESASQAEQLCRAAVAKARPAADGQLADSLIVVGGDGMMHLGLNACAETGVPLGLIAAGRGNDFCRGIGVPNDLSGALATIIAGRRELIDRCGSEEITWLRGVAALGRFDSQHRLRRPGQLPHQSAVVESGPAQLRLGRSGRAAAI